MSADLSPLLELLPWFLGAWLLLGVVDRVVCWVRGHEECDHSDEVAAVADELRDLRETLGDVLGVLEELNGTAREIRDGAHADRPVSW